MKVDRTKLFEKKYPHLCRTALEEVQKKLLIDKHELDSAAVDQPQLYHQVAAAVAEMESIRDAVKLELERTEAEVDLRIRRIGQEQKKLTEKLILSQIAKDGEFQKAQNKFLFVRELAAQWQALRSAFDQRASMLKVMANLYSATYFSTDGLKSEPSIREATAKSTRRRLTQHRNSRS